MTVETVLTAAKRAWGVDAETLRSSCRQRTLAFQRHLCVLTLREDCGFSQDEACSALGLMQANYKFAMRSVTEKLVDSDRHRMMATSFLREFDKLTR